MVKEHCRSILNNGEIEKPEVAGHVLKEKHAMYHKLASNKQELSNWENIVDVLSILILHYYILLVYYIQFTIQELFRLLEFLAEAFRCHLHHGIEKLLLKTQVSDKVIT